VVLHGGPDFDHTYLLPELDQLADSFRLLYYDQRGRGRSAPGVAPDDVSIVTEVEDLDGLRDFFGLEKLTLLGHSWGGLLGMEYAVRHPDRVSHLILMNSVPGTYEGRSRLRDHLTSIRTSEESERLETLRNGSEFSSGDIEAEAEYLRIHFRAGLSDSDAIEKIVSRARTHFTPDTIVLARAIEQRLYDQTWLRQDFDLLSPLSRRPVPTLLIHGDTDMIPVDLAAHIAEVILDSRLSVLDGCGHFAYMERPEEVHRLVTDFLAV
jgi:proline iminopeptidase